MPHSTVSHSGMLSRSPGATHFPSRPMMIPATITPMISMTLVPPCDDRVHAARRLSRRTNTVTGRRHTQTWCGPASPDCNRASGIFRSDCAETDLAGRHLTDLDVCEPVGRHQHPAPLVVGQLQQTGLAAEGVRDERLDLFRALVALQHQLTIGVLHADLDLHETLRALSHRRLSPVTVRAYRLTSSDSHPSAQSRTLTPREVVPGDVLNLRCAGSRGCPARPERRPGRRLVPGGPTGCRRPASSGR